MVDDKLVSRSFWVGDIEHVRIVPTIIIIYYLTKEIKTQQTTKHKKESNP
jgi:hypothetical protein